jgi:ribosome-binding factor A
MTLRTDRVGAVIREIVAEALTELTDPRLGFVSVTGVSVSADLTAATVFFSTLHLDDDITAALEALLRARPRLQRRIAEGLQTKRTPKIRFEPDPAVIEGERIDALLRQLNVGGTDGD